MADTNPYTSTRVCEGCGKVMHNVYHAAVLPGVRREASPRQNSSVVGKKEG